MSHPQQLPDYLDHMLEAARLACSYVEGVKKTDFIADRRTQQAVIRNCRQCGQRPWQLVPTIVPPRRHVTSASQNRVRHETANRDRAPAA